MFYSLMNTYAFPTSKDYSTLGTASRIFIGVN